MLNLLETFQKFTKGNFNFQNKISEYLFYNLFVDLLKTFKILNFHRSAYYVLIKKSAYNLSKRANDLTNEF